MWTLQGLQGCYKPLKPVSLKLVSLKPVFVSGGGGGTGRE